MRLLFILLFVISFQVQASFHHVRISHIDAGEVTLLFLSDGKVAKVSSEDQLIFFKELDSRQWLFLTLDKSSQIIFVEKAPAPEATKSSKHLAYLTGEYQPSVLETLEAAKKIFRTARYVSKESQCYNRAHIWSYEWFKRFQMKSEKAFIFFTRKYIRKFEFEWWFHVAPSVQVIEDGIVTDRILDVKYSRNGGPQKLKNWTDIFMRNNAVCPVINTYSDYANYPESGWCYVMKVPMYYYQPIDIEEYESGQFAKSNWLDQELTRAYLEAFNEAWPTIQESI